MLMEALTRKSAQSFTLYENQITMWGCLYSHYTTYSSAVTGRALDVPRLIGGQDTEFSIRADFPLGQKHLPYHRAGPRKLKFFKSDCRFLKIFVPPLTYGLVLGKLRLQVRSSRLSRPSKPLRQRREREGNPASFSIFNKRGIKGSTAVASSSFWIYPTDPWTRFVSYVSILLTLSGCVPKLLPERIHVYNA